MGNKTVVVTRPGHDLTMRYLSHWAQVVMREAQRRMHTVIDLQGERANQREFTSVVRKKRPNMIFLNGHGAPDRVAGQDDEILVEAGKSAEVLRGAVTYAVSCRSAAKLGPASIAAGARAYVGYADDFIFVTDVQKHTRPQLDRTAAMFLEPSNLVSRSLLKGNTVAEARERGRSAFGRNIRKLLTSEAETKDSSMIRFLFWDMQHLVAHGDQAARL